MKTPVFIGMSVIFIAATGYFLYQSSHINIQLQYIYSLYPNLQAAINGNKNLQDPNVWQ